MSKTFRRPVDGGTISNTYAQHTARRSVNPGVDFAVGRGTLAYAPESGVVKLVDRNPDGAGGRVLVIFHDNGYSSDFLHLSTINVNVGDRVSRGQKVATTGGSAFGKENGVGNHLHWTLRTRQVTSLSNSGNVDGLAYLGNPPAPASTGFVQVVADRQQYLNVWYNAGLKVDGIDGPATKAKVAAYQRVLGVKADGIWGPITQAAHQKNYDAQHAPKPQTGRPSLSRGSKGTAVGELQRRLNRDYPAYSKLVVDNDFGPATDRVVREFQRRAGLKVDGIVGPATWGRLGF